MGTKTGHLYHHTHDAYDRIILFFTVARLAPSEELVFAKLGGLSPNAVTSTVVKAKEPF